jgi:hypothetical protein
MNRPLLLLALAETLLAFVPLAPARAAQFEVVYKSCPNDAENASDLATQKDPLTNCKGSADRLIQGHMVLRLTGDIETGDAARLQKLLDKAIKSVSSYGYDGDGSFVTLEMAGDAGSIAGAIELGSFFRDKKVQTRIMRGTTCSGPCALAFMGGQTRWTRLTRVAVDRRLEAGGRLIFRSPLYSSEASSPNKLRGLISSVQDYAAKTDIPQLVLAKILGLAQDETFAIDNVFWAKVADITVDGAAAAANPSDDDYISACLSRVNWTYGLDGAYDAPPHIYDKTGGWDEGEVVAKTDTYVLVAVVFSYEGYDYWCALNRSRTASVTIPRQDADAVMAKWEGRNSLLHGDTSDAIELKGNEIYSSKAPNDFAPTHAQNGLDVLLHPSQTKLAAIADPHYKWNPWTETDPWFELDGP